MTDPLPPLTEQPNPAGHTMQASPITGHTCPLGPQCDLWHRKDNVTITCGMPHTQYLTEQPYLDINVFRAEVNDLVRAATLEALSEALEFVAHVEKAKVQCEERMKAAGWVSRWFWSWMVKSRQRTIEEVRGVIASHRKRLEDLRRETP